MKKVIYKNKKNNSHLKVGELYEIHTKNGTVEKYLAYIDTNTMTLYFSEHKGEMKYNKYCGHYMVCKRGGMGTAHNINNVNFKCEG